MNIKTDSQRITRNHRTEIYWHCEKNQLDVSSISKWNLNLTNSHRLLTIRSPTFSSRLSSCLCVVSSLNPVAVIMKMYEGAQEAIILRLHSYHSERTGAGWVCESGSNQPSVWHQLSERNGEHKLSHTHTHTCDLNRAASFTSPATLPHLTAETLLSASLMFACPCLVFSTDRKKIDLDHGPLHDLQSSVWEWIQGDAPV